ncbi:MAG: addiction module killer protein [Hydrogenophilales bacterium CG_4_9_14_3_um_filter_63_34]|nr:MAG: addiction module killer protein [Hydrogenophilales bacterium CG_4_10_14_3_um_filter_63_21]PJB04187.1 MAG: addiction module killer protein [Hydrogenophilales bacterium CG_4_9_14_3_um_filter_63_34]
MGSRTPQSGRRATIQLRIGHGPGYRVYYARAGERLILLLVGGDKRRQQADIETALSYWADWKRRNA